MKKLAILLAALLVGAVALLSPTSAVAQTETMVTAGAAGVFPTGATFNGVPLNGLRFGIGVTISSDGSAAGNFQTTLLGTSALGQPQEIVVEGKASSGSVPAAGTASFWGVGTVNMGDGTPTIPDVPFTVTVAPNAEGKGTLTLILGITSLPAATVTEGSMTVK